MSSQPQAPSPMQRECPYLKGANCTHPACDCFRSVAPPASDAPAPPHQSIMRDIPTWVEEQAALAASPAQEATPPRCPQMWRDELQCIHVAGHEGAHGFDHTGRTPAAASPAQEATPPRTVMLEPGVAYDLLTGLPVAATGAPNPFSQPLTPELRQHIQRNLFSPDLNAVEALRQYEATVAALTAERGEPSDEAVRAAYDAMVGNLWNGDQTRRVGNAALDGIRAALRAAYAAELAARP